MTDSTKTQCASNIFNIAKFFSTSQLAELAVALNGPNAELVAKLFIEFDKRIQEMHHTRQQEGQGDKAIVHLHYYIGTSHWYIIEKDIDDGVEQAFGYTILNGDLELAEMGYISIKELTAHGAKLDLDFKPCSLAAVKAYPNSDMDSDAPEPPKPWVVVEHPGTDEESIYDAFSSYEEALRAKKQVGDNSDVMFQREDGSLTTEF